MNCWIKVCGITRKEDIIACKQMGIDSVGFLVRLNSSWSKFPETISQNKTTSLIEFTKSEGGMLTTLLIHSSSISEVTKLISETKPDAIQVQPCSKLVMSEILLIRNSFPSIKVIKTYGVNFDMRPQKVEKNIYDLIDEIEFLGQSKVIDFANLDTVANGGGGQGKTHDWNYSKKISSSVNVPCILAGGINPSNVKEALKVVTPFGVDVMSGVGEMINGRPSKAIKDHKKIRELKSNAVQY